LVDATYEPVNKLSSSRDQVILRDYQLLRDDLTNLAPDRSAPLVLIKTNVCRLLEPKLQEDVLSRSTVAAPSTFLPMVAKRIMPERLRQPGVILRENGIALADFRSSANINVELDDTFFQRNELVDEADNFGCTQIVFILVGCFSF
jgi:hypothetical protein